MHSVNARRLTIKNHPGLLQYDSFLLLLLFLTKDWLIFVQKKKTVSDDFMLVRLSVFNIAYA